MLPARRQFCSDGRIVHRGLRLPLHGYCLRKIDLASDSSAWAPSPGALYFQSLSPLNIPLIGTRKDGLYSSLRNPCGRSKACLQVLQERFRLVHAAVCADGLLDGADNGDGREPVAQEPRVDKWWVGKERGTSEIHSGHDNGSRH